VRIKDVHGFGGGLARAALFSIAWIGLSAASAAQPGPQGAPERDEDAPTIRMPYDRVFALVVGVEFYETTPQRNLQYAIDDAEAIDRVFRERYGYEATLLKDPSRDRIEDELDRIERQMTEGDGFVFYFAGHGTSVEGNLRENGGRNVGYFIPRIAQDLRRITIDDVPEQQREATPFKPPAREVDETDAEYESRVALQRGDWEGRLIEARQFELTLEQSIRMDALRQRLIDMPCKHAVAFFDACFSGLAASSRAASASSALELQGIRIRNYRRLQIPSRSFFSAGTGNQVALEHTGRSRAFKEITGRAPRGDQPIEHGVFTYELLEALQEVPADTGWSMRRLGEEVSRRVEQVARESFDGSQMWPQLREITPERVERTAGSGSFVFVPAPERAWLERVETSFVESHARETGEKGQGRGDLTEQDRREILERDRTRQKNEEDQRLLETRALVVLAARDAQRIKRDPEAVDDRVWRERRARLQRQASLGNADAMSGLFYVHAAGLGGQPDEAAATRWLGEALGSSSSEAKQAFAMALEQGIGYERNFEGFEKVNEDAMAEAEQAKTAVAGSALAVYGLSNDNPAAAAVGIGMALFSVFKSEEQSIEKSIAQMDAEILRLDEALREMQMRGRASDGVYDEAKAALFDHIGAVDNLTRNRFRGSNIDRAAERLLKRATKSLRKSLSRLGTPWTRADVRRSRSIFQAIEMDYARLTALIPYVSFEEKWNDAL